MSEHTVLVAVTVTAESREQAESIASDGLSLLLGAHLDSWWIAEDDRRDGSDCDSAVFVPMGTQEQWAATIAARLRRDRAEQAAAQ